MNGNVDKNYIKNLSISEYLESRGFELEERGNKKYCLSPFSYERTPSFCVYESTNTFYDWSSGIGGDIILLVSEMEGLEFQDAITFLSGEDFTIVDRSTEEVEFEFDLSKYTSVSPIEKRLIKRYAFNRAITQNYIDSVFYVEKDGKVIRRPSMGFVHIDESMNPCGIKMRDINPINSQRFSARGRQKFYYIKNHNSFEDNLFVIESESSANSFLDIMSILNIRTTVLSFGSWNNIPRELPEFVKNIDRKRLIIDYDGSEEDYVARLEKIKHLDLENVEIKLEKGTDMNSMLVNGMVSRFLNKIK